MRTAAVVTAGTELVTGLVLDTNAAELGVALTAAGLIVEEHASAVDDEALLSELLKRLTAAYDLVVVTGGLGPTHDDVTREAASHALSLPLARDAGIAQGLRKVAKRHSEEEAVSQVFRQADVLAGARVLIPRLGTAPGQIAETARGHLVLLPGPPREMRSMLPDAFDALGLGEAASPLVLGAVGLGESDVQVAAQRALLGREGIGLTVLAGGGVVRVVLFERGCGRETLEAAGAAVAAELGEACYTTAGETLAEAVLREARTGGVTLATAESCTGGMIAAALTDIAGSSDVFAGGVVSYSNGLKQGALGVPADVLERHGAVSEQTAEAMASGCRALTGAGVCVAVTGIAGPGGGSDDKPVGTVWFAIVSARGTSAVLRRFPGDRATVRLRATVTALDLVRREILAARSAGAGPSAG